MIQPTELPWRQAEEFLKRADPVLGNVIDEVGPCTLAPGETGLAALVQAIVTQQLGGGAARAIHKRVLALFDGGPVEAAALAATATADLRNTGISFRKIEYLHDLAAHVLDGRLDFERLQDMDDEAVVAALTGVRGIGRWTAEMYLMFGMARPDIFPIDDLVIRRAISELYGLGGKGMEEQARRLAEKWRPYRSVASWYMYGYVDARRGT